MLVRKRELGSFTVEAVFVIPFVLFILATLMEASMYFHDACIVRVEVDELLSELAYTQLENPPIATKSILGIVTLEPNQVEKEKKLLESRLERKLIICSLEECSLSTSFQTIKITCKAVAKVPYSMIATLLPSTSLSFEAERKIYNPTMSLRYGRLLWEEFEKTKAFEKVEELIHKVKDVLS